MSKLKLRLILEGMYRVMPAIGVVANIYDITEDRAERKSHRDILLPIGDSKEITVEPGKYMVEAILPSGQMISEEVTILEGSKELELRSASSPHEWLGWQQYSGNLGPTGRIFQQKMDLPRKDVKDRIETLLAIFRTEPLDIPLVPNERELFSRGYFHVSLMEDDIDIRSSIYNRVREMANIAEIDPNLEDLGVAQLYLINQDTLWKHHIDPDVGYRSQRFDRTYLLVFGENIKTQYCVLPFPWHNIYTGEETAVEVLVYHSKEERKTVDSGHRIFLSLRDESLGAILGYLGSGQLLSASKIWGQIPGRAIDMLFYKGSNPLAAAAGSYILLATEELTKEHYWHEWVSNLMRWFPWLPDGAIQHGWLMLNRKDVSNNIEIASKSLLEGYMRGIPYYSKGVTMLMEGLAIIEAYQKENENEDRKIQEALVNIRELAIRINMRQPFTTVLLN